MAAIKQDHLFQRRMIFVYRPKMSYLYEITSRSAPRQTTHCKASGMLSPSGLGPLHEKMLDCLLYGWWSPWIKWFKIVYCKVDGFLGLNDFGRSDLMVDGLWAHTWQHALPWWHLPVSGSSALPPHPSWGSNQSEPITWHRCQFQCSDLFL